MARIRSVHPGLWSDEAFCELPKTARLFWIGLWNECDDHGVFEAKPVRLKLRLLPADNASVPRLLRRLEDAGMIRLFEHRPGEWFGVVRNFMRWQRPKKPSYPHPFPAALRAFAGGDAPGEGEAEPVAEAPAAAEEAAPTPPQAPLDTPPVGNSTPIEGGAGSPLVTRFIAPAVENQPAREAVPGSEPAPPLTGSAAATGAALNATPVGNPTPVEGGADGEPSRAREAVQVEKVQERTPLTPAADAAGEEGKNASEGKKWGSGRGDTGRQEGTRLGLRANGTSPRQLHAAAKQQAQAVEPDHPLWEKLKGRLDRVTFRSWIQQLRVEPADEGCTRLIAPSDFHARHVRQHLGSELARVLGEVEIVGAGTAGQAGKATPPAIAAAPA